MEDRPAKRRKVEGDVSVNPAFNHPGHPPAISRRPTAAPDIQNPQLRLVQFSTFPIGVCTLPHEKEAATSADNKVPDLPARPWNVHQRAKSADEAKPTHRSRVNVPVPTTPDSLEVPTPTPYLVPKKPAGFFPWMGKHPEDIVNDTNVKQGYFDKPPNPTEKELNTARVPLYNAFKHKSGVENLSILFSLVLDQKNQHGRISSTSTFKPPPRVTLTEAKRKSWIADLANADVPLRRLSRTIPQGIRGQILLDQCLQSTVPFSRAIWFAKCVCANEIRTLKRKGTTVAVAMGTEGKWLREWTVHVEQFLETHLGQAKLDPADWKSNIQYAVRLSTRLYLENLLDRDHYLDWMLRSFASAHVEQIPFWLMIIHIYKLDLVYYRRRGRRLAETMAQKYQVLQNLSSRAAAPLLQRLHHAIRGLLLSHPINFLMPDQWPEVLETIKPCLDLNVQREQQILAGLNLINGRAMGHNKKGFLAQRTPDQVIVDILDAARAPFDLPQIAKDLTAACPDVSLLAFSCLDWACTRFRQPKSRIYLFARLVKRWQRVGHDIDSVILNYLSACREGGTTADPECLRHLVAQLARSNGFPLSKYLQWLMVRGLPSKGAIKLALEADHRSLGGKGSVELTESSQLVLDLPLQNVEDHVVNLRNYILQRCGFDVNIEEDVFRQCVQFIEARLSLISSRSRYQTSARPEPAFAALPWNIKSQVSMWLRSRVIQSAVRSSADAHARPALLGPRLLNCEQFSFIRSILECMEDEAVLADVIGILCCAQDDDLVASLVATIHSNADAFSALGALEDLQRRVCQIYMSWRSTKPTMPLLTAALLDLCTAFPVKTPTIKMLQQDLVRGDRGRAVAACSPYSDGIAESLQQAGATFVEDFEAILQSEPNMNEQTMNGLFAVLVDRIEKQEKFGDDSRTILSFCQLLSRLRLCRRAQGDLLIRRWMAGLSPRLGEDFGPLLFQNLLGTGCVPFAGLLEATMVSKQGLRPIPAVTTLLQHILSPEEGTVANPIMYQTRTSWFEYCQQEPRLALEVLCQADLENARPPSEGGLLSFLVNDRTLCSTPISDRAKRWLAKSLNTLLGCREGNISGADLRALLKSINLYSYQYVQLRFWLASQSQAESGLVTDQDELVQVLSEALDQMLHESKGSYGGDEQFAQLLQGVGSEVANRLRHKVENEFLEALPKLPLGKVASPLTAVFPSDAHNLAAIMERAFRVCSGSTNSVPGFMAQLIDKLSQYLRAFGSNAPTFFSAGTVAPSGTSMNSNAAQMMSLSSSPVGGTSDSVGGLVPSISWDYLNSVLQMVCLQRPALISAGRSGPNVKQGQSEQLQLLVRLALLYTHPALATGAASSDNQEEQQKAKDVHELILNVIATIVDEVGDEVKMMSAKLLKDKIQDGPLKYLFGSVNITGSAQVQDMGHGLQMAKEGKGVVGDWKPRVWEVLDNGSGKENETSLGLGLFGARRI